jgi:MoaA/NifB/PqqE/SkfB family radical SAM enzyme
LNAVSDAASLGYNVLSVSGGEPLLYSHLESICSRAHRHGMITTLVTNGTIITERKMHDLRYLVDMIAVSLDGTPERHNRLRGSDRAFHRMEARLNLVRQAGIPFAFVFTLTNENLPDLEWVADFAVHQGATMLQVHPLDESGRACDEMPGQVLADQQTGTAWMVVECLREIFRGKLMIHFDALNRYQLPVKPDAVADWLRDFENGRRSLGEILSPLVIEDDGSVVPLRYGFPKSFALGSLHTHTLSQLAEVWKHRHAADFCRLYTNALRQVRDSDRMFANLYETLSQGAELVALRAGC